VVECFCGRKAAYLGGEPLCPKHFRGWLEAKVRGELDKFVGGDDVLAVAASGGKDSTTLLDIAHPWARERGLSLFAISINEGIGDYRKRTLEFLRGFCRRRDIDLQVYSFRGEFGATLDSMLDVRSRLGKDWSACRICGTLRRYLLNKAAREAGADKLLLAHNLDDELQTLLMNLFTGNVAQLSRKGELAGVTDHPLFVRRFKPLIAVPEKATATYALLNYPDLPRLSCPHRGGSIRVPCRELANRWESDSPGTKKRILETYLKKILPALRESADEFHPKLSPCSECGEPSSRDVCNACRMLRELIPQA